MPFDLFFEDSLHFLWGAAADSHADFIHHAQEAHATSLLAAPRRSASLQTCAFLDDKHCVSHRAAAAAAQHTAFLSIPKLPNFKIRDKVKLAHEATSDFQRTRMFYRGRHWLREHVKQWGMAEAFLGGIIVTGGLAMMMPQELAQQHSKDASNISERKYILSSKVPSSLQPNDYDMRLSFAKKGHRLSYVRPTSVSAAGGKIVVCLAKQVPQGYREHLDIVLARGLKQVFLKPTAIKQGRKLCVEVPPGLELGDYEVRLSYAKKILHGAIPLVVRDGPDDVNEEAFPEDGDVFSEHDDA